MVYTVVDCCPEQRKRWKEEAAKQHSNRKQIRRPLAKEAMDRRAAEEAFENKRWCEAWRLRAKQEREQREMLKACRDTLPPDTAVPCRICRMFLNGEDQYQDHLKSKLHRLNMDRFGVQQQ